MEIVAGGRLQVCGDVDQVIEVRSEDSKFRRLLELMGEWISKGRVLIFGDRKERIDTLLRDLQRAGYTCLTLHGGKDQLDRISTISDFKSGVCDVMVATSIAARGLDVRELVLVVNYDVPNHIEDYVHRVGRTGRAGRKGTAVTFVTPDEERYAPGLVRALEQSGRPVPADLAKLAEGYQIKDKAGLAVERVKDGYVTSGFKFTKEELSDKDKAKRAQMSALGFDSDGDEEEEDEDEDEGQGEGPPEDEDEASRIARLLEEADRPDSIKRVDLNSLVNPNATGLERAQQLAKLMAAKSAMKKQERKGTTSSDGVHYETEVEINDFPLEARWQVTSKEDQIAEMHPEVAITVRGTYVQPGRKVIPGEPKLHLLLEGTTEAAVKAAKKEILRILREQTALDAQKGGAQVKSAYAKYSVL